MGDQKRPVRPSGAGSAAGRTERIHAAGAVLWRGDPAAPLIAVVHRPRYGDWSFPKGKLRAGEHPLLAAVREVREETCMHPVPGRYLSARRYQVATSGRMAIKTVRYWAMRSEQGGSDPGNFVPSEEIDELRWLPPAQARSLLSYPPDRQPLDRLLALPLDLTAVLLIRHGRAGQRRGWPGPDHLRPLDAVGRRQALLLAEVAAAYQPRAVFSADVYRCEQTVAPLAARLGLSVQPEPSVEETRFQRDPDAALGCLRELARGGRPVAVCSQGAVIPPLLARLAERDGVPATERPPQARKGSLWTLFFAAGRLRDAHYLPRLEPSGAS